MPKTDSKGSPERPRGLIYILLKQGEMPARAAKKMGPWTEGRRVICDSETTPLGLRVSRVKALNAIRNGSRVFVRSMDELFETVTEASNVLLCKGTRGDLALSTENEYEVICSGLAKLMLKQLAALEAQGRKRALKSTAKPKGGRAPYGWKWVRAKQAGEGPGGGGPRLVRHEGEREALDKIGLLRSAGWTWDEVAVEVNKRGMRRRNGSEWSKCAVRQAYVGAQGRGESPEGNVKQ